MPRISEERREARREQILDAGVTAVSAARGTRAALAGQASG